MANTTQRTVELNIKLNGVQSLEDLEQVTSEINAELKQIPVNSKAFNEMSALAKKASSQIREIDSNLQGVTGVEKTEALFKLGEGLAGAFAAAQGASLLFGEKTGEQLEKVIAQVGGLVIALDGVKKVSEAFSAQNIRGLKAVVLGWKESTIAAKLFGTGVRAALTATGIGLLVVILGTIVANWDKVKQATIKAFNVLKDYVPLFFVIGKGIDSIKEKFGNLKAFIAGIGAAIKAAFTFGGPSISEAFDAAVKKSNELQAIDAEILRLTTETKTELDNQLEIMGAQGGKQLEIYNLQIKYNDELVKTLETKKKTGELTDDEQKLLDETIQKTKVLIVQRQKFNREQEEAARKRLEALDEETSKILEEEQKRKSDEAKAKQQFQQNLEQLKKEEDQLKLQKETLLEINELSTSSKFGLGFPKIRELNARELFSGEFKEEIDNFFKLRFNFFSKIIEQTSQRKSDVLIKKELEGLKEKNKKINDGIILFETENDKQIEITTIKNKILELENNIIESETIQINLGKEINKLNKDSYEIIDDIVAQRKKEKNVIQEQKKLIKEQYAEELQAAGDLTNQLLELRITNLQAIYDFESEKLDDIQSKKEEYANKEKDLNDLLADAEGQRYEDILAQINANAEAIKLNDAAEIESKKKIADAEYKMAKARRTQAIIDATIQGALGVIEALPNIILAALVGGLALASIATIVAQPLPPKPEFNQGGFVGGNSMSGDKVNASLNSGELVLTQEQQAKLFRVANIGSITPNSNSTNNMFDYDLMASAMSKTNIFVSVKEINDVQNRLKVVESRSSIGR